jgi:hypothetical protein
MLKVPETASADAWHRYFAMVNNNRAWGLAAQAERSQSEDLEMLNAAHTAATHWAAIGTPLNLSRANMLLTAVHALLGHADLAWPMATQMKQAFDTPDTPAWEAAFVHVFYAHAAAISGHSDEHSSSYSSAKAAIEALADAADREIVQASFVHVPTPD